MKCRGLYDEKISPRGGYQMILLGEKYEKGKRKRGENVKEKGGKGKETGRKRKEDEKTGRKRVK